MAISPTGRLARDLTKAFPPCGTQFGGKVTQDLQRGGCEEA
jgi:hypothetical protein